MKLGIIGLGKMGFNLALNLIDHGHEVVGFDLNHETLMAGSDCSIQTVLTLHELIDALPVPKVIWLMVPSGKPTSNLIYQLSECDLGDEAIIIDGGNTNFEDTMTHAEVLHTKDISFLDCGTSGGVSGARYGACLMIGGDQKAFDALESVFLDVTCENGLHYTGRSGSGHYLKMVHNGIEYGIMQAIGEGFEILNACEFDYNNAAVAKVWNHGSVIEGWLMELAYEAFKDDPNLDNIAGKIDSSGEGAWTVESALKHKVPAPVITLSLMMRYRSKQDDSYSGKVVAALRNKFGGHEVHKI